MASAIDVLLIVAVDDRCRCRWHVAVSSSRPACRRGGGRSRVSRRRALGRALPRDPVTSAALSAVLMPLLVQVVVAAGPVIAARADSGARCQVVALLSDVPIMPSPTVGPCHHALAGATLRRRGSSLPADDGARRRYHGRRRRVDGGHGAGPPARAAGRHRAPERSPRRRAPRHRLRHRRRGVGAAAPRPRTAGRGADARWCFSGAFSRFDGGPRRPTTSRGATACGAARRRRWSSLGSAKWRAARCRPDRRDHRRHAGSMGEGSGALRRSRRRPAAAVAPPTW